jgi:uncharacterized OsmC-like protein/alpha/beta superfamily hydrolase
MPSFSTQRLFFIGSQGNRLSGRLELSNAAPVTFALFAHCFTCSKDYLASTRVSRALAARGVAVLRFDFTGLGDSEGDFAKTSFTSNIEDIVCAADYLREHFEAPRLLIGHSLGGTAVLAAAQQVPESRAVATIAAPSDPMHIAHHFAARVAQIERSGAAEVEIAGRGYRVQKKFLEDLASYDLPKIIGHLNRMLWVFHGLEDDVVDIEHAEKIYGFARHPKNLIRLDGADHLLTERKDADYIADVLAAWVGRFVEISAQPQTPATMEEPGLVVSETGQGCFAQCIRSGHHSFSADEPREHGGDDTGPTPYDLLLASLGACTSMTIRMYAARRNLPLRHVAVTLRHAKIHARDCEDCDTKEGRIDHIERSIALRGDLSEDQRAKLVEIADKCPVHRTLRGEIRITTRLLDE